MKVTKPTQTQTFQSLQTHQTHKTQLTRKELEELLVFFSNAFAAYRDYEQERLFWLDPDSAPTKWKLFSSLDYSLTVSFSAYITLTVQKQHLTYRVHGSVNNKKLQTFVLKHIPPSVVVNVVSQIVDITNYYRSRAKRIRERGNAAWENPCPELVAYITYEAMTYPSLARMPLPEAARWLIIHRLRTLAELCLKSTYTYQARFKNTPVNFLEMLGMGELTPNLQQIFSRFGPLTPEYAWELLQWLDNCVKELRKPLPSL